MFFKKFRERRKVTRHVREILEERLPDYIDDFAGNPYEAAAIPGVIAVFSETMGIWYSSSEKEKKEELDVVLNDPEKLHDIFYGFLGTVYRNKTGYVEEELTYRQAGGSSGA